MTETRKENTNEQWYWFGRMIDSAGRIKLRQFRVCFTGRLWRNQGWFKGKLDGSWRLEEAYPHGSFETALQDAKVSIKAWCSEYETIDEGVPPYSLG